MKINPSEIQCFKDEKEMHFCFVTDSKLCDQIELLDDGRYLSCEKIVFDTKKNASVLELQDAFNVLLKNTIPKNAHVLVIAPNNFFRAPSAEAIGPTRKIMTLPCNSTPTTLDAIEAFWQVIVKTDPNAQEEKANFFFNTAEKAEYLTFIDDLNQTEAKFNHMHDDYVWNEQGGLLSYGSQQMAPAGEISVCNLPVQDFDENLRLDFNGTIAFNGVPIVHSGTTSHSLHDQQRYYDIFSHLIDHPVILELKDGEIQKVHADSKEAQVVCDLLDSMFMVDSRYRILLEIGFGMNTENRIYPGNHAMNETYGGSNGVPHFGIGLTPYTQYHIDIICPNTRVLTNKGELLFGQDSKISTMSRQKVSGCFCIEA
jgi:hypothetical protein